MELKINSNGYPSDGYSNSTLSLALIPRERLEPIKPPKVVSNVKFDLDLLCAQALSRLNYAIEANVSYQLKLIEKEFQKLHNREDIHITFSGDSVMNFPSTGVLGNYYHEKLTDSIFTFNGKGYSRVAAENNTPLTLKLLKKRQGGSGKTLELRDFVLNNIIAHSAGGAGGTGAYEKAFINGPYISGYGGGSGGLPRP